ncbi:hypothetical protein OSB04_002159 [Centaurea solstitialis]|uniref:Uncharacterized protein n=1 Tax=Centaurea solstitialis TaxID=347529 RepID=A0AA38TZY2_9ASTR|nr:hypothetical protein OSB04_002159 [Centaurea solstitialis]
MLGYSDEKIVGNRIDFGEWGVASSGNASNVVLFNEALDRLWAQLKHDASSGRPLRKYASKKKDGPRSTDIFGLMQCTPDLPEIECYICLSDAVNYIQRYFDGRRGARVIFPSCNISYEDYKFFDATVSLAQPSFPSSTQSPRLSPLAPSGKHNVTTIVVTVVATFSVVILVVVFFCVFLRRKTKLEPLQQKTLAYEDVGLEDIITAESLQYSFDVIRAATDDFSENNKLGKGGFGLVYKGMLRNGQEIAVKRLSKDSGQGKVEFKNEVLLLAKLQHRNLVRLLGFSIEGSERLLVYEFVRNASLNQFIFDFGMARLFTPEETQGNTSRIVGTYGYMAPEYVMHGQFSVKSDVFSFGVLVLEVVTGHTNHSFQNETMTEDFLSHAWKSWRDGTSISLIDPTLIDGSNSVPDIIKCINIGLLCVQDDIIERPTMALVVLMLSSLSINLAAPLEPAFFMRTFKYSDKHFSVEYTYSTNKSRPSESKPKSSQPSIAS